MLGTRASFLACTLFTKDQEEEKKREKDGVIYTGLTLTEHLTSEMYMHTMGGGWPHPGTGARWQGKDKQAEASSDT